MTSPSTAVQVPARPAIELLPPSITVRVGKRRLSLTWRVRKPLPMLLSRLLRRAWVRVLAPGLRLSLAAAAVCAAWQATALAAAPAPGTLPTGWSVVNGNLSFSQNGNTLNINQLSPQAIAAFASFSIGADATVNVLQPGASAALLAKVTGADISQIYGKLSANGTVVLYNPNGVVIGPSGTVDAARFIATSLAVSDSDFLAGRLNFVKDGTAGLVDNQGKITSATGGSVYLIGGSASNSGIITSPQGEVILAAGQTVTLADTATPGVTVNVTGSAGNVTNLGTITAEAGRIGVAAGLITNSGVINASSVVREGGRIFLRASGNLTTTASSSINADGTQGGNVTLYAANTAFIDGDVSALGTSGAGGFVDTSGLKQLEVVKVPRVGAGGTWLIDPLNLDVVSTGSQNVNISIPACSSDYAITSTGSGSRITAETITSQLNNGTNVQLVTGDGEGLGGNINVTANISKTGSANSSLTLNAANNISITADITSQGGALDLILNSGYSGPGTQVVSEARVLDEGKTSHLSTVDNGARILLNGGSLSVNDGSASGDLLINNGTVNLGSGNLSAAAVTVNSAGTLTLNGGQGNITSLNNNGTVNVATSGNNSLSVGSDGITNNATFNISGNVASSGDVTNNANATLTLNGDAASLNVTGNASLTNYGLLTLAGGNISAAAISNEANGTIAGNGTVAVSGSFTNDGVLAPGSDGTVGHLILRGFGESTEPRFSQGDTGKMLIDIASADSYDQIDLMGWSSARLGGTLKTRLLDGYAPTGEVSINPFNLAQGQQLSDYFGTVTGDIVGAGQQEKMFKAVYDENGLANLSLRGAETFTYQQSSYSEGGWEDRSNWSSNATVGNVSTYMPTQIDTVVITGDQSVRHGSGDDTVANLQIGSDAQLNQQGGTLTVRNSTSNNGTISVNVASDASEGSVAALVLNGTTSGNGTLNIGGTDYREGQTVLLNGTVTVASAAQSGMTAVLTAGDLTLGGDVRLSNLTVSNGTVTGNVGSRLVVTDSFSQSGGNLTLADAALSQADGSLAVGNITANNLVLEAASGNLSQNTGTAMHVKSQLIASASNGITFNNTGNQIAGFAANNSGTGDITLKNTLNTSDASAVSINGVTTTRGNISIDNTGGVVTSAIGAKANFLGSLPAEASGATISTSSRLTTLGINSSGQIKTSNGTVSVVTHSPLTIGSGGVSATGTITLTASASSGSNDTLLINGVLVSTGGNITLSAGDSMTINANISTSPPGVALLSVASGQVIGYAQGVTIVDANGTRTPVTGTTSSSSNSQAAQAVQQQQNQQSQDLQTSLNNAQPGTEVAPVNGSVVQQTGNATQTVGGTTDHFGDEGEDRKQAKKPLPMCT
ncbi:filamentous hemagglutinin N-terminal domain-containing protein [Herbaspirillum sp. C9C3]|uniref:beta strand repeat-containing protein n=1 Tax=Herbaspirillum sp. C9C3 TaxID=2735271 RepID=UPI00158584FB|nr:filamentous hemagglutinin N-terminal domain-containing protein [Herbaspirillum sp. C9C3]